MNHQKLFNFFIYCLVSIVVFGCGVRGDPVPPGYPTELGRGRPTFKDPQKIQRYSELPTAEEIEKRLAEEEKADEDEGQPVSKKKVDKKMIDAESDDSSLDSQSDDKIKDSSKEDTNQ